MQRRHASRAGWWIAARPAMDRRCGRANLRLIRFRSLVVIRLIDSLICGSADPGLDMATRNQHDEWICSHNRRIGLQMRPALNNFEIVRINDHDEQRPCLGRMPLPASVEFLREFSQHPSYVPARYCAACIARQEARWLRIEPTCLEVGADKPLLWIVFAQQDGSGYAITHVPTPERSVPTQ
jgi:hypothetical protein